MNWSLVVGGFVASGLLMLVVLGYIALQPENIVHTQTPAKWCETHNGSYYISRTMFGHGGPHCELANGTTVHLR